MGILGDIWDGITDVVGDVVDGVFDFVDDVFGVDLGDVLDNDFVRYGLMAASLFTGGVAIVNGVMKGWNAATQATGYLNKFVEGASAFVQGVGEGFLAPGETFKNITGMGETASATSQAAEQLKSAVSSPDKSVAKQALESGAEGAASVGSPVGSPVGDPTLAELANMSPEMAARMTPKQAGQMNRALAGSTPSIGPTQAPVTDVLSPSFSVPDAIKSTGQKSLAQADDVAQSGFWSRLGNAATDFITSPLGMNVAANAVAGWSQAAMLQKRWDEEREMRRERRESWANGVYAPRTFSENTLQNMKARQDQFQGLIDAGNAANARYYG